MGEHTPGPWTIVEYGDEEAPNLVIHSDGELRVCFMATPGSPFDPAMIAADARLIAAAPTTLDALNAAQYYIGQLEAAQRGTPVRDLDEAQSAFVAANTKARSALNHD